MPNRTFKFETMSADDFEDLILDMPADERWELIGGRVVRGMVGARWEHHRLVQNISFALMQHFRAMNSTCRPYNETFWLKEKLLDLQVFPDVMVRCGPLEPGAVHLSDPVVIVEVLSPGTEARDRHEKWALYQKLDSVKHYVLVARDKASLDIFWLRDESLADSDNLPAPEVIAQEIVDDLEAALEQFRLIAADLGVSLES